MAWAQVIFGLLFICMLTSPSCTPTSSPGEVRSSSVGDPNSSGDPEATPTQPPNPPAAGDCLDSRADFADKTLVEQVCVIVNKERAAVGAGSLKLDAALSKVAQDFAEDMVKHGYFSHTSPDGQGPVDRLQAGQIVYKTWGENIAYSYKTSEAVMAGWMNSAGHRANILNTKFGKIGVGFYQNYWVQVFTN